MPKLALHMVELVERLREHDRLGSELVFSATLPALAARTRDLASLDHPLPEPLTAALRASGVERLFSHQAEGVEAVRRGESVLVTTPTASGKSLVFHVPPLEEAARGGSGRALFLFPLKALGQDQRAKVEALATAMAHASRSSEAGGLDLADARAVIYDGDTPTSERAKIRRSPPRVLVTNPDMLHLGILSRWTSWTPFLRDLRWIVLDELHAYRGIFGSHFHHVLQRLLRVARSEGADPVLIASSATAANAAEFAETLGGRPFRAIEESGAPREARHVLLFRPDASPYTTALELFVELLQAGAKTIVFTKARRITELLYSWLRGQHPELAKKVASYRSGFLPEERRKIEARLFSGELEGVISTSALEMGIDVGGLDACILVGYPGSVMATWQRSGRAGRSGKESLTALVALPDALDQYFLDHPQALLDRPCERLIVDPDNPQVARAHLVCAAAELPLPGPKALAEIDAAVEAGGEGAEPYARHHRALVDDLVSKGLLLASKDGREVFSARPRPQRHVNLRGGGETYQIVNADTGELVGTVDGVRVLHECHPGAIYLHGGRQYQVETLDLDRRHVLARRGRYDFFTVPLTEKETEILEVLDERRDGGALGAGLAAALGRLKVTERVVGFERKRIRSQEVIGQEPLDLPPVEFETVGLWWLAPRSFEETLKGHQEHFLGSLHATEHAAISLFPVLALCDRGDIGGISCHRHPQVDHGAVFIYDGHPGGVGIAARGFRDLPDLLGRVLELLAACDCESGCPSCIQSPKCGNGNRPLDKAGAARVLRLLLDREELAAGVPVEPLETVARIVTREVEVAAPQTAPEVASALSTRAKRDAPALPMTVLFDLETRRSAKDVGGWGNAHKMGISIGVALVLEEGRFEVFPEERVGELAELLERATLVVGFNIRRFDYAVLSGYTGVDYARRLETLDLLEDVHRRIGFRVKLDDLAKETLGAGKSADGLQCLEWVKQGRFDLVEAYCRRDVEVLRDLYLHGRREGCVWFRHEERGRVKIRVEW